MMYTYLAYRLCVSFVIYERPYLTIEEAARRYRELVRDSVVKMKEKMARLEHAIHQVEARREEFFDSRCHISAEIQAVRYQMVEAIHIWFDMSVERLHFIKTCQHDRLTLQEDTLEAQLIALLKHQEYVSHALKIAKSDKKPSSIYLALLQLVSNVSSFNYLHHQKQDSRVKD